jgi:hypothetical protein
VEGDFKWSISTNTISAFIVVPMSVTTAEIIKDLHGVIAAGPNQAVTAIGS